jgi:amidohydrolase
MSAARKAFPAAVTLRRDVHRHPELSGKEFRTAALVHQRLSDMGLSPRFCCGKTGVVASLVNGAGETVALRADMDALPVEEDTGLKFSSVDKGVMHACGHDIHTACLVGAAHALFSLRHLWKGTVTLLFQPSEESAPGGAFVMLREGVFPSHACAVFGLHVNPEHPRGVVGIKSGPDYAGIADFDVTVVGKGAHGAMPEKAIHPITAASEMIVALEKVAKKECSKSNPCTVTVGKIAAGTKHNIIPDEALFGGTIRALTEGRLSSLLADVKDLVGSIARGRGARAEVEFEKAYPPGYNNPALAARAFKTLSAVLGKGKVVRREKSTMLAEDFARFQRKAPGVYFHLGVRPSGRKDVPGIHTPQFNPDERAILTGIAVHTAMAIDILQK